LLARAGVDPALVGQVVGGCVSQVGMQSYNVTRTAWLAAGLPETSAATTVDAQCGSSQQALTITAALIASGVVDVAVACGVEMMSNVPLGSSIGDGVGKAIPRSYFGRYEFTTQFEGAERIAQRWGITRRDADQYGLESQQRLAQAWAEGRFDPQLVRVDHATPRKDGGSDRHRLDRDEGQRGTSLEALAGLKPVTRPDGVHTAGTSSQISDGAAALLLASASRAADLGLTPRARIVDTCTVGSDPVFILTGPIPATRTLLERNGMRVADVDLVEINEAFASVVLAWERELGFPRQAVNPNGGAIAHGHPLGATGACLVA
jgi:acetyl-CoA C-acetyltransferase